MLLRVAVSDSLSGGAHLCPSVTEESDDRGSFDASVSDDADGGCLRGLTGLYNHGNTCYANATIQALSNWYVQDAPYKIFIIFITV